MNRDHVRGVAEVGDVRIARKINVNTSKGSTTEAQTKNGEATFEAKETLFERNASGFGGGEDEAGKVEGFGWDHLTSLKPGLGVVLPVTSMHFSARYSW